MNFRFRAKGKLIAPGTSKGRRRGEAEEEGLGLLKRGEEIGKGKI